MIDNIIIDIVPPTPPVSIEDPSAPQFSVFPNPTSDRITIRTEQEMQRIDVIDMMGRRVHTTTHSSVDLSPFPRGIYLIRCISAGGANVQRIIKTN